MKLNCTGTGETFVRFVDYRLFEECTGIMLFFYVSSLLLHIIFNFRFLRLPRNASAETKDLYWFCYLNWGLKFVSISRFFH